MSTQHNASFCQISFCWQLANMAASGSQFSWPFELEKKRRGREINFHSAMPDNCQVGRASVRPKFGIGRKYRPKPLVSVSVSEPKLLQPKPKLQYIDFSEITLSTYVHVLHGKTEIT